ncbi:MAG: ribonuclease E/G, partial [Oceanobacter sp.]
VYSADVNSIVVDSHTGLKRVRQHLTAWNGGRSPQGVFLDHHRDRTPILEYFRVNAAIREALKPRVDLPSGGYIIIEPTEALTVVDVNSGSFTRSGANYDAGAQTPLAAVMAAGFLVLVVLFLPDLTRYLPLSAMAGTVLLIAWNLFDLHHMKEIFHASKQERLVFIVTFASTLLVKLEFAIYIGVFASMVLYLNRTCRPGVIRVAPIQNHPQRLVRNVARYDLSECPQMPMLRFDGSIYFGSVDHFQGVFRRYSKITESGNELIDEANRALLINARGINFIDLAGADMLVQETRRLEKEGIQLWITSLKGTVIDELKQSGHYDKIGPQHFIESTSEAIAKAVPQLDADVCARCPHKIFRECPGRG